MLSISFNTSPSSLPTLIAFFWSLTCWIFLLELWSMITRGKIWLVEGLENGRQAMMELTPELHRESNLCWSGFGPKMFEQPTLLEIERAIAVAPEVGIGSNWLVSNMTKLAEGGRWLEFCLWLVGIKKYEEPQLIASWLGGCCEEIYVQTNPKITFYCAQLKEKYTLLGAFKALWFESLWSEANVNWRLQNLTNFFYSKFMILDITVSWLRQWRKIARGNTKTIGTNEVNIAYNICCKAGVINEYEYIFPICRHMPFSPFDGVVGTFKHTNIFP